MTDYKRDVYYLYNYENGQKRNNVGFARVEQRNGTCKITSRIRVPSMNGKTLRVCLFVRENGQMQFLPVGTMSVVNMTGESRVLFHTENILGTGYDLEDMKGMVIYDSQEKFFGSEWDDQKIFFEEFKLAGEKRAYTGMDGNTGGMERNDWETGGRDGSKTEAQTEVSEAEQAEKGLAEMPGADMQAGSLEQYVSGNMFDDNRNIDKKDSAEGTYAGGNEECLAAETPVWTEDVLMAAAYMEEAEESRASGECSEILKSGYGNPEEAAGVKDCAEKEAGDCFREKKEGCREQLPGIFYQFPRMQPFEDDEMTDCIRIEPQDIGRLPMESWVLANNSFLLHSYYSYRHLLLARRSCGSGYEYVLCAPGICQNREQFMAAMFGFCDFKPVKNVPDKTGEFGYWYMPVVMEV